MYVQICSNAKQMYGSISQGWEFGEHKNDGKLMGIWLSKFHFFGRIHKARIWVQTHI